ncbi:MAG TPA: cobalamin-independent methionine synthase II family protein, partial [Solirubrobacter sp.]|nr:cobalamin-independent methionine synthase II family protein [Solirubrobacter sp.]
MRTSLVGSYPQPDWLIDRDKLRGRLPPRVRASDLWRIDPKYLREAQDAAVLAAIRDQERAGLDIVTDGEMRRESYSNYFVMALDGVDVDTPGAVPDRNGNPMPAPRVTGPIARRAPIEVRDATFLNANTDRLTKVTVPGPFTMAQQAVNEHYGHDEEVAFAFADAVREEIQDLFAAGVDVVQLDEPWMESRAEQARAFGLETLQRALDGVDGTVALHICFGYPLFVPGHQRAYRFLAELAAAPVAQISIETAQAELDLEVLAELRGKTIILGVL